MRPAALHRTLRCVNALAVAFSNLFGNDLLVAGKVALMVGVSDDLVTVMVSRMTSSADLTIQVDSLMIQFVNTLLHVLVCMAEVLHLLAQTVDMGFSVSVLLFELGIALAAAARRGDGGSRRSAVRRQVLDRKLRLLRDRHRWAVQPYWALGKDLEARLA